MQLEEILQSKQALYNALASQHPAVSDYLRERREKLTTELTQVNNENTRGRLWEIQDFMNLQGRLQSEIQQLQKPMQSESDVL